MLTFDTSALRATVVNFYALDREIQDEARRLCETAGDAMVEVAQTICPVDTGFMRDHIKKQLSPKGLSVSVGWDEADFLDAGLAFYPPFVELGTRFMPARPVIWAAYDEVAPQFEQDLAALVESAAERAAA